MEPAVPRPPETADRLGSEWSINPAVSPTGATIHLEIKHRGSQATLLLTTENAYDLAANLQRAADWCKDHEARPPRPPGRYAAG